MERILRFKKMDLLQFFFKNISFSNNQLIKTNGGCRAKQMVVTLAISHTRISRYKLKEGAPKPQKQRQKRPNFMAAAKLL
jgi:hypothetical protein